jgi:hypothetical protein
MDGAWFSLRLLEDDKGDCHLDAPFYTWRMIGDVKKDVEP